MVRLYIENREIDLDATVQFAITKQFEELSNPTTIINDWSKTVSIPFTVRNHNIFGHIYNPDKITITNDQDVTGIYFDPLKKLDFRLEWDNTILMVGYAKMNEIKQINGNGTYEITLFGQLGKVFQEMNKITFDTTSDLSTYIIDGSTYVDEIIDRTLVKKCWDASVQSYSKLYPKYLDVSGGGTVPHPAYKVTDIIGFAPNNSFSNDFKYDTFQASSSESLTYVDYLNENLQFEATTGISAETLIPNGFLPREVGEYRSYLQLPFIFWNKLFQVFQYKSEEITGYQFVLDSSWFNDNNPYWHDLVYMLKPFNQDKQEAAINYYSVGTYDMTWTEGSGTPWIAWASPTLVHNTSEAFPVVESFETYPAVFDLSREYSLNISYSLGLMLTETGSSDPYSTRLHPDNALELKVKFLDTSDNLISEDKFLICDENYTGSTVGYKSTNVLKYGEFTKAGTYPNRYRYVIVNPLVSQTIKYAQTNKFKISYVAGWKTNTYRFVHIYTEGGSSSNTNPPTHLYSSSTFSSLQVQKDLSKRSNCYFILNDLWNKDYNLFNEILKYCKMYHILISVDDYNKQIIFKHSPKCFENFAITNWTDKVDKSKDFIIKPVTFENKYVLFNYKDSKTSLGEEYKKKFGVNYGDYRLVTDYNFNTETNNLFKDITPSIVSTDNILSYRTLTQKKVAYTFAAEIFVSNKDKDKKQVDIFGAYFFHNGLANFDVPSGGELLIVNISDDSAWQAKNSTYMYSYIQSDRVIADTYPKLDIVRDNNMCVFNSPKENFTYLNNYSNKNTIYSNFWEKYINERYNVQNKQLTCYVRLKPSDWNNFKYSNFVKIGNQIYIVNKIYDYDVTNTEPTKVDLITIQDVSAYTTDNFELLN